MAKAERQRVAARDPLGQGQGESSAVRGGDASEAKATVTANPGMDTVADATGCPFVGGNSACQLKPNQQDGQEVRCLEGLVSDAVLA